MEVGAARRISSSFQIAARRASPRRALGRPPSCHSRSTFLPLPPSYAAPLSTSRSRPRSSQSETRLKWYPIPLGLGMALLVITHARHKWNKEKIVDERGEVIRPTGPWSVYVIGALPLNTLSRVWGYLNSLTLPIWFRPFGFKLYSWVFGVNLDEIENDDLTSYDSLGTFFYRRLKPGARPIDKEAALVSPADGTVLHFGSIEGRRIEQVKGVAYSLDAFLGLGSSPPAERGGGARIVQFDNRDHELVDDERFASVNGIEYSLDQLLGDERRLGQQDSLAKGWAKLSSWRWWRSWMWRDAGQKLEDAATTDADTLAVTRPEKLGPPERAAEEVDASVESPDSAEKLGRYASVAYEMGTAALPPVLQPRSPGKEAVQPGHKLFYTVIYLAPGDYHRFHSPTNWVVERRRHFPGDLYSVSPWMASRLSNLFVLNERVALIGRWRYGFFSMIPVGATNVGSIKIHFDKALRTNTVDKRPPLGTFSEASYAAASRVLGGQPLPAGEEMGGFGLGSTVVLVFEAPESFRFVVKQGQHVCVGQPIGVVEESSR